MMMAEETSVANKDLENVVVILPEADEVNLRGSRQGSGNSMLHDSSPQDNPDK